MKIKNKLFAKILLVFMIAVSISVSSIFPAIATEKRKYNLKDHMFGEINVSNFIKENRNLDSNCPWTSSTKIKETIYTYDLDGNINGYIINLYTDSKPSGYIVYILSGGELVLSEYGYCGVYSIQGKDVTQKSISAKSKLIPVGLGSYLLQIDTNLYTVSDNINVTKKKQEFKEMIRKRNVDINHSSKLNERTLNIVQKKQVVNSSATIPDLWKIGYQPVTMGMYGKGCTVTCGVNMLKYWTVCRKVPNLYNYYDDGRFGTELKQTYGRLYVTMDPSDDGGVNTKKGYSGITQYCKKYKCTTPLGGSYLKGLNWEWYKTQINNGNFMCINAKVQNYEGDKRKDYHSFSGVGYQETSTGNYMRVGDQWTRHYSHFFNVTLYPEDIDSMWYYRWK